MEAMLEARLPARSRAVISNNPGRKGLDLARARGVADRVVDHREFPDREAFDAALARRSTATGRICGARRLHAHAHRAVRRALPRPHPQHPSLAAAGISRTAHAPPRARRPACACTAARCTSSRPSLDHGPIVIQAAVPVLPGHGGDAGRARARAGAPHLPAGRALVDPEEKRSFEVWLATGKHYLPVRIRYSEKSRTFDSVVTGISIQ
jgi:phosphoribosylglycinamide formyltransferase 1